MRPPVPLRHVFVDSAPDALEEGVLYVSVKYRSVMHKCCCGCGNEVVTPLGPTDWTLIFDGVSVSLDPSVGNWSLPCRSHYWIKGNTAHWAGAWSDEQVAAGRARDRARKERYFGSPAPKPPSPPATPAPAVRGARAAVRGWLSRLWPGR